MNNGILIKTDKNEKLIKEKNKLKRDIQKQIELLFSMYDDNILRLECNQNKNFGKCKINLYRIEPF